MNINIGSVLFTNHGAMFPTIETTVEAIENGMVYHRDTTDEEGTLYTTHVTNIKTYGTRSVNGSPLGVFLLTE